MLLFKIFSIHPELLVAMSGRADGSMKLADQPNPDTQNQISKKRQQFLKKLNLNQNQIVSAGLVHGAALAVVTTSQSGKVMPQTDGLMTNIPGVFLSVTTADCLPIVIYHPQTQTLALLHAGWRGLAQNIIAKAIKKLVTEFHINATELLVGIGPGIGNCHYEVQPDLVTKFQKFSQAISWRDSKTFLDLKLVARAQFLTENISQSQIEISSICTACNSNTHFSFRQDQVQPIQAQMMVAGIRRR